MTFLYGNNDGELMMIKSIVTVGLDLHRFLFGSLVSHYQLHRKQIWAISGKLKGHDS